MESDTCRRGRGLKMVNEVKKEILSLNDDTYGGS